MMLFFFSFLFTLEASRKRSLHEVDELGEQVKWRKCAESGVATRGRSPSITASRVHNSNPWIQEHSSSGNATRISRTKWVQRGWEKKKESWESME